MSISLTDMRSFLSRAYSSINQNKINGIYAEVDFLSHIVALGYANRVSPGGWIMRPQRIATFGSGAVAVFPEEIAVGTDISVGRTPPPIPASVDAAAANLNAAHIATYFCYPEQDANGDVRWIGMRRGIPNPGAGVEIVSELAGSFVRRPKPYNFLRYSTDVGGLSDSVIPAQYSLEALRIYVSTALYTETSDIDRLLWGAHIIYPVEVKEKTRVVADPGIGDWFGIDVGPFTKLAFFAAWYGQLTSLFVVREIGDTLSRELVQWWAIDFSELAKHASWVFRGGGATMLGGASAVIRVPITAFRPLDKAFLDAL